VSDLVIFHNLKSEVICTAVIHAVLDVLDAGIVPVVEGADYYHMPPLVR